MSESVEIKIDWFRSLKWTLFAICILIIVFSITDCMNNFDFANNIHKENKNESQDSVDRRKLTHKIYTITITFTVIALSLLGIYGAWGQSYGYVLIFAICMTVLIAIEISVFFWTFNWNLIYGNIVETIVTIIAWIFWNMIRKRAQTMH